jgi:L-threonylcarbamoyladenylate synthase
VYGLGASAYDSAAVAKVFEIKGRPTFDPLIVHVLDEAMLGKVVTSVPALAKRLIEAFWPGPLTLVLNKSSRIPDLVTSGLSTVAVRMPAHPVAQAILKACKLPLAAPSANPFGYLSPTRAEHVERMLGDRVDLIVDGGATEYGVESSILLVEPQPTLLRAGAIPIEALEAIAGPIARMLSDDTKPLAPGRLPQHYAPRTPLRIVDVRDVPLEQRRPAALLAFRDPKPGYSAMRILSRRGDLRDAAAHLFQHLHELDELGVERIDVEAVPEEGIGVAIMDRLHRAAAR